MTAKIRIVKSIADLTRKLKADFAGRYPVWYRGHAHHDWGLVPGYHRLKSPPPERILISKFKQNANMLVAHTPQTTFDWLFWMQHYGVPTRLLDWTESPLVALYFAVESKPKSDGMLWALDPVRLNKITKAKPDDYTFVPSFDDEEKLGEYETLSVETHPQLGVDPMAVIATRNNARIQAQLGVFTISHFKKSDIRKIGNGSHLIGYKIPKIFKQTLRKDLITLGFGKFQIFPEIVTIGEMIRKELV